MNSIEQLRIKIDQINTELLELLSERAKISIEIGKEKARTGQPIYDPIREQKVLQDLISKNKGPFSNETIVSLFQEIFKASKSIQQKDKVEQLLITKTSEHQKTIIDVKGETIGGDSQTLIFGPCSIESYEQLETVARYLKENNLKFLRGGAYKPRTSPYSFQGLGKEGILMMEEIAKKYDLISVVEIMDEKTLDEAANHIDIIQIGARNMQNYSLLKAVGLVNKPILLKRGFQATIEEFKLSAEYILSQGNRQVILCERGIRTFETATRNTLDLSAVPILRNETHLPVIVDVSHAAGRKDILLPLAKASLVAGAHGIMAEVHPNPQVALSDAQQQLDLDELDLMVTALEKLKNLSI